jgi:hypothetical protein
VCELRLDETQAEAAARIGADDLAGKVERLAVSVPAPGNATSMSSLKADDGVYVVGSRMSSTGWQWFAGSGLFLSRVVKGTGDVACRAWGMGMHIGGAFTRCPRSKCY